MSPENESNENIAQTVERITRGHNPIQAFDEINVGVIPAGFVTVDLTPYMDRPRRIEVNRGMTTVQGFVQYVRDHTIAEQTAVYVYSKQAQAIIDDLERGDPRPTWGSHKATLVIEVTAEWSAWTAASGEFVPQRKFIDFIQDRAGEISAPPLADLLAELRGINAEGSSSRRDAVAQLSEEQRREQSIRITNQLPDVLDLWMPMLKCESDVMTRLQARLEVKLADIGVQFAVRLVNPDLIMDTRIRDLVGRLRTDLQGVPVYF